MQNANSRIRKKQSIRHQQLLEAAAEQINALGAGAVNLDEIAKAGGFTRNALYYYIADRNDLAFQCFERSCEVIAGDLQAAIRSGTDPVERIRCFVSTTLTPNREPIAVLGEHDFLTEPERTIIFDKTQAICAGVSEIIRDGIERGHFRPVDSAIASHCLMSMLSWVRLASRWLGEPSSPEIQRRLADAVLELMLKGFAIRGTEKPSFIPDALQLTSTSFNAFDRDEAKREKRSQLLGAASCLFNRHGIDGTSVNDIATSVGATKGALYHYFEDKSELVIGCYERAFETYDLFVSVAKQEGASGFQKAMIAHHLNCQAQVGGRPPLILQTGLDALPDAVRPRFVQKSREIWREVQAFLVAGQADGSCRQGDTKSLSEAAAGSFSWVAKADLLLGVRSASELADNICDIIGFGILKH